MSEKDDKDLIVDGLVTSALPNTFFLVKRNDTGEEIMTYLSGKMRLNRIRVMVGDKVSVLIDKYGGKSRIIKRN